MRPIRSFVFIAVLLALLLAVGVACGQEPPPEEGGQAPEDTGGEAAGETTEMTGETTAEGTGETTGEEALTPGEDSLVVYSGRSEELVGPIIEQFEEESGVDVQVRYGDTAELAATIVEEGENSPADVFFAQDPGGLGAVEDSGAFRALPEDVLGRVEERFRSPEGEWVGTSGRARAVAYNTEALSEEELPASILDYTDPEWDGRIGWAPTNGSFQAFVTALRVTEGEDVAREWLEGIQANNPFEYPNNTSILEAVAAGEVEVGFVNHYYLFRALEEQGEGFGARNHYQTGGDPGALVITAGVGVLETSANPEAADGFVDFLLSQEAQQYFADETYEYPMIEGVEVDEDLPPLSEIDTPEVNLGDLDDLEGTLELLRETGVL